MKSNSLEWFTKNLSNGKKQSYFYKMAKKFISEQYNNLEVVDITARGKGVVKSEEGKVIFVSGVVPGDIINVETYKKRRGYFEANLIEILEPSPNRIEAECEHFGVCGGCKWQNMSYEAQLKFKQKEVLHNIKNLSGMSIPEIDDIQAAPQPYFYRNKMEYTFSNQRWLTADEIANKSLTIEKRGLGFHKAGMWDKVVDISQCHLQAEPANEIRNAVKAFALEHQLDFFNPRDQKGFLRSLMIRNTKGVLLWF
jgi:23S rRNA (uracil1939-C5)-methyltransferase